MDTTTKVRPKTKPPAVGGALHICPNDPLDSLDPFEKLTALCGAACYLFKNGDIMPTDFDFYLLGSGHEAATCMECRKAAGLGAT